MEHRLLIEDLTKYDCYLTQREEASRGRFGSERINWLSLINRASSAISLFRSKIDQTPTMIVSDTLLAVSTSEILLVHFKRAKKGSLANKNNHRLIKCLITLYKMIVWRIELVWKETYGWCSSKKDIAGRRENLLIGRCERNDVATHYRYLSMTWINYPEASN